MDENKNVVPFDVIPQINTGSFLTKEQVERFKDDFKDLTVVVRCKDCKNGHHIVNAVNGEVRVYRVFCKPTQAIHEPDWFCADGERL